MHIWGRNGSADGLVPNGDGTFADAGTANYVLMIQLIRETIWLCSGPMNVNDCSMGKLGGMMRAHQVVTQEVKILRTPCM